MVAAPESIDRKGTFEGIADYNSKTPRVRANYIFKFMERYNRRLQRNGKMCSSMHGPVLIV